MIFQKLSRHATVWAVCIGIGLHFSNALSQTLISGTVLDDVTSSPIAKATITLKVAGKAVLTGSDGKFTIAASSSVLESPVWSNLSASIAFNNKNVYFSVPLSGAKVIIDVFDLNGKLRSNLINGMYSGGVHNVLIGKEKKLSYICVLKWAIGAQQGAVLAAPGIESGRDRMLIETKKGMAASSSADAIVTDRYGYFSDIRSTGIPAENITIRLKKMSADSIVPPGMKLIEGNTFIMGSQTGDAIETPEHQVTLSSYFVDSTEVTQLDYETLMKVKPWLSGSVRNPTTIGGMQPTWGVTWYDAVCYANERSKRDDFDTVYQYTALIGTPGNSCRLENAVIGYLKKGYRLLTEAEWEYACGGGRGVKYFWGNQPDSVQYFAWYIENSNTASQKVAQKKSNSFYLYDISGNVQEWVNDWLSLNYDPQPVTNPSGPNNGSTKVRRGGFFGSRVDQLRVTYRVDADPSTQTGYLGFRVALPKR